MRRNTCLKSPALILVLAASPAFAQTFPAIQSTQKYEIGATGAPQFYGNNARATSQVKLVGGVYTIRDTGNVSRTSSFGPISGVTVTNTPTHTIYTKSSGGTTETFRVYKQGQAGPIVLTYSTYAQWRETTPGAGFQGATKVSDTYFTFGTKTAAADMPRTSGASYTAALDGTFVNRNGVYSLSGAADFATNWGNGTLTFNASPIASGGPTPPPALPTFATISGTGSINFNGASFSANGTNGTHQMSMSGYFYGPAAAELGAVFKLSGGGGMGNGAIVGKKN
jgi:hypothetical protein